MYPIFKSSIFLTCIETTSPRELRKSSGASLIRTYQTVRHIFLFISILTPTVEDAEIPDHLIEEAFKQFTKEIPHYELFLMDRCSIMRIARASGDRQQRFTTFARKLEGIFSSASDLLQFESAACTVGSDVHRDQELSTTICSPMVSEVSVSPIR